MFVNFVPNNSPEATNLMGRCSKTRGGTCATVNTAVATIWTYACLGSDYGLPATDASAFEILIRSKASVPHHARPRTERGSRGTTDTVERLEDLLTLDRIVHFLKVLDERKEATVTKLRTHLE
jgi:hypothetical protein